MNEAVLSGEFVSQNLCDGVTVCLHILPLVSELLAYAHSSLNTGRLSDLTPDMGEIFGSNRPCFNAL